MLTNYQNDFSESMVNLRHILKDSKRMETYYKNNTDPNEYLQAQNFLK